MGGGEVDLSGYQQKTDNSLTTAAKTVVGAINENKSSLDDIAISLKSVDAVSLNGKKFSETMTKAEYDAIAVKDNDTIYLVDDDESIIGVPDFSTTEADKILAVNSNGTALAWVDKPTGSGGGLTDEQAVNIAKIPNIESTLDTLTTRVDNLGDGVGTSKELPLLEYYTLENAKTYLNIPTYDGSNQCVHSKVLYFKNGWNNYKYWMAFTPLPYYPSVNENVENPSIVVSNDGVNWFVPDGLTNPLDNITNLDQEYNSDTHLVMVNNTMEIWYRHFNKEPAIETIYKKTSIDGINWSNKIEVLKSNGTERFLLCPVVLYDENKYKIWFIGSTDNVLYKLRYYESTDGTNLTHIRDMQLSETSIWHHDIIKTKYGYELVASIGGSKKCIYSKSIDNVNWSSCTTILNVGTTNTWDCDFLYRPNLTLVDDDYYFYYTGRNDKVSGAKQGLIVIKGYNANITIKADYVIESDNKKFVDKNMFNKLEKLDIDSILLRLNYLEETLQNSGTITNVQSVTLNDSILTLKQYNTYQLSAEVLPANATNRNLTWESDNETVVKTDNNGLIQAVGVGIATISATSHNGISDTCAITVEADTTSNIDPSIDGYMPVVLSGHENYTTVSGFDNATSDSVTYKCSVSEKLDFKEDTTVAQDMICNKLEVISVNNLGVTDKCICGSTEELNEIIIRIPVSEVGGRTLSDFTSYLMNNEILVRAKCKTQISKTTLNGSENWNIPGWANGTQCIQFETVIPSDLYISQRIMSAYCNEFKTYTSSTSAEAKEREGIMLSTYGSDNLLVLSINKSKLSSNDTVGLKNYLLNNNINVYISKK